MKEVQDYKMSHPIDGHFSNERPENLDPTPVVVNGIEIDRSELDPIILPSGPRIQIPASPYHVAASEAITMPRPSPQMEPRPETKTEIYNVRSLPQYLPHDRIIEKDIEVPDYDSMSRAQQLKARLDFSNKMKAFRSAYPDLFKPNDYIYAFDKAALLPDIFIEHLSFQDMIKIHEVASNYRSVMIVAWFGIEAVFTWMGIDTKGFTEHQIKSLNKYESHLLAMGERSTIEGKSMLGMEDWSPETSIMFLTIVSSVVFVAAKVLAPKFGMTPEVIHGLVDNMGGILSSTGPSNPVSGQIPSQGMLDNFANLITTNPNAGTVAGNIARNGQNLVQSIQQNVQPNQPNLQAQAFADPLYDD